MDLDEGGTIVEEIKVGEYVRTPEQGYIGKLVEVNKNVLNYYKIDVGREIRRINGMSDNYIYSRDGFGLKHSSNVLDLLEVGDVVTHGEETIFITAFESEEQLDYFINLYKHENLSIKSIVTKEQFALAEYRLEE